MGNYSDYNTPVACPYCGADCHAEFADVGVGMVQCSPYYCESCGAYEIGPYDGYGPEKRSIEENNTGWYEPSK